MLWMSGRGETNQPTNQENFLSLFFCIPWRSTQFEVAKKHQSLLWPKNCKIVQDVSYLRYSKINIKREKLKWFDFLASPPKAFCTGYFSSKKKTGKYCNLILGKMICSCILLFNGIWKLVWPIQLADKYQLLMGLCNTASILDNHLLTLG